MGGGRGNSSLYLLGAGAGARRGVCSGVRPKRERGPSPETQGHRQARLRPPLETNTKDRRTGKSPTSHARPLGGGRGAASVSLFNPDAPSLHKPTDTNLGAWSGNVQGRAPPLFLSPGAFPITHPTCAPASDSGVQTRGARTPRWAASPMQVNGAEKTVVTSSGAQSPEPHWLQAARGCPRPRTLRGRRDPSPARPPRHAP